MYLGHDEFQKYHPAVNFSFFALVIILTVVVFRPACLLISLAGAMAYSLMLSGGKAFKFFLKMPLPIMALMLALNPLFVHRGVTVLFYLGESPITKEAFVYGGCAALMTGAVIMWFYCYGLVMTSDKFMAVFGRVAPKTSLVFSMVLRFIPRLKTKALELRNARRGFLGEEAKGIKESEARYSMLATWALENSIETADSMRARGYGLKGRTHYSGFSFAGRDLGLILLMTALTAIIIFAKIKGALSFAAYPVLLLADGGSTGAAAIIGMALLCALPTALDIVEGLRWKYLRSEI